MKKTLLLSALLFAGFLAKAQTFPPAMASRFQTILDSLVQSPGLLTSTYQDTVGVSVAVSIPGIGTWEGVAGPSRPGVPFTTQMPVAIASNSKLFTAVMMLKLQEAGVLSLNDHIGKWITTPLHDVDTSASIRQLLQHETGIYDYFNDDPTYAWVGDVFADVNAFWSYSRVLDSIGAPHFPLGTAHRYSNTNYKLCAWIIENATGQRYGQVLHQYITTPLGLTKTFEQATDTTALNAIPRAWGEYFGTYFPGLGSTSLSSMARGSGSIASTPKDVVAFYQAVMNGNFLSASSKAQLLAFDPASQYGLGLELLHSPSWQSPNFVHGGSLAGFNSEASHDLTTGASIFVAVNSYDANVITYARLIKQAFKAYFPMKPADAGVARIVSPQGTFCNGSVTPVVVLTNHGSNTLTSATIAYRIGSGAVTSYAWTGSLASGASTQVTLPVSTAATGTYALVAWTQTPNGSVEGYAFNDTTRATIRVDLSTAHAGYFSENFEGSTTPVLLWNANPKVPHQWGVTKLTGSSGHHSLARANSTNSAFGDVSNADMPLVRLVAGTSPELRFRYAFSAYPGASDSLQALISTDCGATWTSAFHKGGLDLSQGLASNANDAYGRYFPHTAAEWRTVTVPLSAYTGDVLVRFRQYNDWGDNIYLDDISIGSPAGVNDVAAPMMSLYPNPARDEVVVTGLPTGTTIRVSNLTGQVLMEATIRNDKTVMDVSKLAPGLYLVTTSFGTKKLVKR